MASATPIPPQEDPWYEAPHGYQTEKPGTVLRLRIAPGNVAAKFEGCSEAYNILFSTTDSNYQPSWAVTTLLVPSTTEGHALFSYQIPYNGANISACPSHILHDAGPSYWASILEDAGFALRKGWYFNIPDFEGPLSAVGDGLTYGHATLDSIRAVLKAGFGLDATPRIALYGYSGGALASGWAAELAPHYTPEIHSFAGAALGGLPSDLLAIQNSSGTPFAGQVPLVLLGLTAHSAPARDALLSALNPATKEAFLSPTASLSLPEVFGAFAGQDVWATYFVSRDRTILQQPLMRALFRRKGRLGHHGVPEMPLFVYKAVHDEITPIRDTDEMVAKYEFAGARSILYERDLNGGHMSEAELSKGAAREWLGGVLDGGGHVDEGVVVRDVRREMSK